MTSSTALPGVPLLPRAPCSAAEPMRVGVLVSGSGTNLQALLDATSPERGPAAADAAADARARFAVKVVVSNVDGVLAMHRARSAGIHAVFEDHRGRSREDFEAMVQAHLVGHGVEVVVLAGFMRVLTASFLDKWPRRVVNVHPALCPAFPGMHAARQALEHGARVTGCTVHLVDAGVDTGPILAQAPVPVLDDDDEEKLQKRIQKEEHALLPRVVDAIARGNVRVVDGRVRLFT